VDWAGIAGAGAEAHTLGAGADRRAISIPPAACCPLARPGLRSRHTDGTAGRFDDIILATGFAAALGPLGALVKPDAKGFARRRDRVVSLDQPDLFFVGHNYHATGGLYNINRDARLAARLIAARSK
jgi:hypothetical protein